MARDTADSKASRLELEPDAGRLELEPDAARRGSAGDLRARLSELSPSHPSAAGFGGDRAPGRRPDAPADYASADEVRVTADRRTHILDGDHQGGGGHRHGTGRPDRTEFPAEWSDDQVIGAVLAVAREPDGPPKRQRSDGRWLVSGTHEGVEVVAVVEADGQVCTGWPREGSPGVVRNPPEETRG